ncbi:hypothetical protein QVD17_42308 [Tagetes erecta]|uniref:Uncharacterized protein n=1 Tax=Tagetes erecta TaxID=13708 RepID=A0AAD8JK67_TARER|nr:hypothetical protein QVD17_42295 [Tagetes erecta]KAK1405997.1 hypothetical protein QVD17_42308 [Tagetes erecta]
MGSFEQKDPGPIHIPIMIHLKPRKQDQQYQRNRCPREGDLTNRELDITRSRQNASKSETANQRNKSVRRNTASGTISQTTPRSTAWRSGTSFWITSTTVSSERGRQASKAKMLIFRIWRRNILILPASDPPVTLFTGNECKPIVDRDDLISLGRWLASLLLYPWYRASISRTFHPNLPADSTRAIKTTDSRTAKTELIPIPGPGPGESFFPAFIQQSERILDKGLPCLPIPSNSLLVLPAAYPMLCFRRA